MIRAVPARILRKVLLMVVLRIVERGRIGNLRRDLPEPRGPQSPLEVLPRRLRRSPLLIVEHEYRRPVLGPHVVPLPHALRGIVVLPELREELLIGDPLGIV